MKRPASHRCEYKTATPRTPGHPGDREVRQEREGSEERELGRLCVAAHRTSRVEKAGRCGFTAATTPE